MKLPLTSIPASTDSGADTPMTAEIRLYGATLRDMCAYLQSRKDLIGPKHLSRHQKRRMTRSGLASRWLTIHDQQR